MRSKAWTTFDSRLSNIFTCPSEPPETNKFPLLGQTSIQSVAFPIRNKGYDRDIEN